MATARPLPATGEIFLDARGAERALRVSWHYDADLSCSPCGATTSAPARSG